MSSGQNVRMMNHGHMRNYGLVEVIRKASNHPDSFIGKKAWEFHDVMDRPVGQIAICLPPKDDDLGWKAVTNMGASRFEGYPQQQQQQQQPYKAAAGASAAT